MEFFTADFSPFLSIYVKSCTLDGPLGTRHQIQAFCEYTRFPYFEILSVLSHAELVRQLIHSLSGDNNLVPFHLR